MGTTHMLNPPCSRGSGKRLEGDEGRDRNKDARDCRDRRAYGLARGSEVIASKPSPQAECLAGV